MEINQQLNLNPQYYQVMDSRFIMNFQNQNVNIIDKYIYLSLNKSDLLYSQRLILSLNVKQFLTYIDGSAKNIGTDKAESIFGFSTFDLNLTFILEFFSSYNNYISVTKASILALLCSIIILPENSRITINR